MKRESTKLEESSLKNLSVGEQHIQERTLSTPVKNNTHDLVSTASFATRENHSSNQQNTPPPATRFLSENQWTIPAIACIVLLAVTLLFFNIPDHNRLHTNANLMRVNPLSTSTMVDMKSIGKDFYLKKNTLQKSRHQEARLHQAEKLKQQNIASEKDKKTSIKQAEKQHSKGNKLTKKTLKKAKNSLLSNLQEQARVSNKPYFIKFGAKWCLPCKMMEEVVLQDPSVRTYMQDNYLSKNVNIEHFDGIELKQKYNVTALPTVLFFDAEGNMVGRYENALSTSRFLELLALHNVNHYTYKTHTY